MKICKNFKAAFPLYTLSLLRLLCGNSYSYGLEIIDNKTKLMTICYEIHLGVHILINNKEIQKVHQFWYIGCIFIDNLSSEVEVKHRIDEAKIVFWKWETFTNLILKLKIRWKVLQCYTCTVHEAEVVI